MYYRSEIDGLRALAIIPVVFFHGGFSLVSGGFVGVDVFFVISGYLITLLIYNDLSSGTFSARTFYERRIKRLFPALFLVTFCSSIIAWFIYLPFDLEDYYSSLISVFNFSSNVHFYLHSGYFDPLSELNPLLHTWSLTVEEQFYFIFPWVLLISFRFGKKYAWAGVVTLIIISFCLAEWRLDNKPMAAFYLLYARGWELLIGSLCALLITDSQFKHKISDASQGLLAWLGLAMILYAVFFFSDTTPAAGRYTLIPTIGTALIILFAKTDSFLGRLLSNRIFVFVGLISYSTYLWHQPILAFFRYYLGDDFDFLVSGALCLSSFILGYFSWKYVEKPFRYGALGFNSQKRVYVSAAMLAGLILVMGFYGEYRNGFPERLDESIRSVYQTPKYYEQAEECFITEAKVFDLSLCFEGLGKGKNALIVGDSHAASLYPNLKRMLVGQGWSLSMLTYARCVPFISNEKIEEYRYKSKFLSKHINSRCQSVKKSFNEGIHNKNFDLVIVLNHYNNWMGSYKNHSFPEFWNMYVDSLVDSFGKQNLLVLGPLPIWEEDLPALLVKDYSQGKDFMGPSFNGLFNGENGLDDLMSFDLKNRGIRFLSSQEAFCSEDGCVRTGASSTGEIKAVAFDAAHLSRVGSQILADHVVFSMNVLSSDEKDLANEEL